MKILEIIPHLQSGGGEKFTVDLTNALADAGHDCTIATLYNPNTNDILRSYIEPKVNTLSFNKRLGADFRCMFRIYKYIRKHKPDIVHAHLSAIMYILVAAIFCRKTRFYATIHSEAKREAGAGLSKWIRKFLFKCNLTKAITISEESEKSFEDFYGFSTTMIQNGCSKYKASANSIEQYIKYRENVDFLFMHAGRIHKVKNQEMLVKAFDKVVKNGVNARLIIAGRAEDKEVYKQIEPYLSDKIMYIGEQSDIRAIMSVSDGFCLSSTMEGMPITIIEAFSVGCVPIVTPVGGGINMIQNEYNGYISKSVSIDDYYASIMQFANVSKEIKERLKLQCLKEYQEKYSIDNTAKNYINIFCYGK